MIRGESLVGLIIISSLVIYLMISYSCTVQQVFLYMQKLRIEGREHDSQLNGTTLHKYYPTGRRDVPDISLSVSSMSAQQRLIYIDDHIKKLKQVQELNATVPDPDNNLLSSLSKYRQDLEQYIRNLTMTSLSEDWKEKESRELSDIVQARIRYVQNPANCRTSRKLVCNMVGCGYGCQVHHVLICFFLAHGTNRTLFVDSAGWTAQFLPLSETCTDWKNSTESSQVLTLDTGSFHHPDDDVFRPPYIPADLAPRLIRLHGNPFAWWTGQFYKYLLRPQPSLAAEMEKARNALRYQSPIVGIHVRRTDKLHWEAKFHSLSLYMDRVDDYYSRLDRQLPQPPTLGNVSRPRRRVYLASDEPSVLAEAKNSYSKYEIISTSTKTQTWRDWSYRDIIMDVHLLSLSDFLVCTFTSNVCRLAYEIMQSLHPDASRRVASLDFSYLSFGEAESGYEIAEYAHKSRDAREIDLQVGDVIHLLNTSSFYTVAFGTNMRTNHTGSYPTYKANPLVLTSNYPTYPESMTLRRQLV